MVTDDGRVKIADFGIAKATTQMGTGAFKTATGMTVGTPAYMAPEQAMARDIGPWTDLYSVGCMAFELFTGRVPFADVEGPLAILMCHVNEPIPPVKSVVPGVDDGISDWIERLLVKDPDRRTGSAAEAWEAFEEITISLLGARWRRDARLPERKADGEPHATSIATGGPYTPPPPDLPPGPMAPPAADTDDQYVSFAPERAAPGPPTPADVEPPPPAATLGHVEPAPPAATPAGAEPPPPAAPSRRLRRLPRPAAPRRGGAGSPPPQRRSSWRPSRSCLRPEAGIRGSRPRRPRLRSPRQTSPATRRSSGTTPSGTRSSRRSPASAPPTPLTAATSRASAWPPRRMNTPSTTSRTRWSRRRSPAAPTPRAPGSRRPRRRMAGASALPSASGAWHAPTTPSRASPKRP